MAIEIELKDLAPEGKMVAVCANCHSVRMDNDLNTAQKDLKWLNTVDEPKAVQLILDEYSNRKKGNALSHGSCYKCMKELYPEFYN